MNEPRLVIINDASVARGGATGLALLQARLARSRGIEVVYLAGDRVANEELRSLGVRTLNVGTDALMKSAPLAAATRGLYNRAARTLVERFIEESDTPETVYHVHGFSKALSPSIFAPLSRLAHRTVIHTHDFFLACPNGAFMDYQAMEPCERVPLGASCLRTNCDKRSYAQKMWRVARQGILHRTLPRDADWARILMIHPDMAPYFRKAGYPAELLEPLRNPATAFTADRVRAEENEGLIFVGRVEAEKGVEELLAAASAAQVPLTVVGEGPLREPLARQYPDVPFLGWMDRADIAAQIVKARALVMPSRYPEPFGLVVAEASLSGVPVIVSDTAFLGAEVSANGLGLVVRTSRNDEFAAALREMVDMPPERIAAMSHAGASGAGKLCTSPDEWIDKQIDVWREAISAGGRAHGAPKPSSPAREALQ